MLFPTHLIAAYIIGRKADLPVWWVVIGAALPDLIDKPLGMLGITTFYHSIGHSLIVLGGLTVVILLGRSGLALWIGWASHLFLDAFQMILNDRPMDTVFLLWPFYSHEPVIDLAPIPFLVHYFGTPAFYVEIGIWLIVVYIVLTESDRT